MIYRSGDNWNGGPGDGLKISTTSTGKADANMHSWAEHILPFMDQANIYNAINFSVPIGFGAATGGPVQAGAIGAEYVNYGTSQNFNVLSTSRIPAFECASTPSIAFAPYQDSNWNDAGAVYFSVAAGRNDYWVTGGVRSTLGGIYTTANPGANRGGIMQDSDPKPTIAKITDGTSNTSLLGEIAGQPDWYSKGKKIASVGSTGWNVTGTVNGTAYTRTIYGGPWTDWTTGEGWLQGSDFDGTGAAGPCAVNCTNLAGHSLYAFHPGGAHILMADGAVRFISANISSVTFGELVTRASGFTLGEF